MADRTPLEKVVNKAIELDKDKSSQKAATILSKGIELCECQFLTTPATIPPTSRSPNPRVPCSCRDFGAAAQNGTIMSLWNKPCTCAAKKWEKCESTHHQQGLSSLVAILVKLEKPQQAKSQAIHLLELNPKNPMGYLRFGQLLRLESPRNPDKAAQALKVYTTALDIAKRDPLPEFSAHYQTLREMRNKLTRMFHSTRRTDPFATLPPELLEMILDGFSTRDMCKLTRVSKTWHEALVLEPRFWKQLVFSRSPTAPSLSALKTLCQRARYSVKTIHLRDSGWVTSEKGRDRLQQLLKLSKSLETLRIEDPTPPQSEAIFGLKLDNRCANLSTLHFGLQFRPSSMTLEGIMLSHGPVIQSLTILSGPSGPMDYWLKAPMPNLKYIRLAQANHGHSMERCGLSLLKKYVPNLEQIILKTVCRHTSCESFEWPNLKVLALATGNYWEPPIESVDPGQLVILDIDSLADIDADPTPDGAATSGPFPNLKSLTLRHASRGFLQGMQSLVKSPQLQYLSLPCHELDASKDPSYDFEKQTLPWFASESLKTMGLTYSHTFDRLDEKVADRFLALVDRCPNVNTIDFRGPEEAASTVVSPVLYLFAEAMKRGIRRIYTTHVSGKARSDLVAFARERGVEVLAGVLEEDIPVDFERDWSVPLPHSRKWVYGGLNAVGW